MTPLVTVKPLRMIIKCQQTCFTQRSSQFEIRGCSVGFLETTWRSEYCSEAPAVLTSWSVTPSMSEGAPVLFHVFFALCFAPSVRVAVL